ncbi:TRAP transporter substrate-binding protein DctP [Paenalcaligenes hominis]|uniref:TRAP transporter substrate-binding protein DctP n=1 Tax=Paenalcaligenes hominis TaxID=643674 RepID=UPI003524DB3F
MLKSVKLTTAALVLGMTSSMAWAADYTMRLSHQFPPAHPTAQAMEQFAKDVDTATDGKVEVQVFGAAQLFKPNQHHSAVAGGQIESAIILSMQWGSTIPEMSISMIPYLMSSPAKQEAFIGSEASKILDKKMEQKGVKNIGWLVDTNDLIVTSSNHLLDTPESYKDVKIRGLNKQFDQGLIALGAVPVTMPGSEAYQALQTGIVDAGITAIQAAYSRKYYEVQKYGAASAIALIFDNLVVNPKWWNGLPEDIQQAIQGAVDTAVDNSLIRYEGVNEKDMQHLTDNGMEVVTLTPEQIEPIKAIMQPAIIAEYLKGTGKDGQTLIDMIEAL